MTGKAGIGDDRLGNHGDDIYARLIAAHEGLTFEESARLNARLVLILANAVGDPAVIAEAIERARASLADKVDNRESLDDRKP